MPIKRRSLLGLISASTFYLTVGPAAAKTVTLPAESPALTFPQGVASGDPQPHGIMLWTRAQPIGNTSAPVTLLLQLGTDSQFSALLLQEEIQTSTESDYTVRTFIDGLTPDTQYYYRFLGADQSISRTGRTRTAPGAGQSKKVSLAFASCQSFEQAYYGSWARMLEEDRSTAEENRIQFVLHLGDFIYERSWHKRLDGGPLSRTIPAFPDGVDTQKSRHAISLADYRMLYKAYLSDPHLQEARARWPFICTWDDHEFANNNFQSYSTYGGQNVLQAQRKLWANQAWFEFIPAVLDELQEQPAHNFRTQTLGENDLQQNRAAVQSLGIYRKLSWGKNLDIVLTDNRSYRSPPCLPPGFASSLGMPMNPVELVAIADAGSAYDAGNPPDKLPFGDGTVANFAKDRPPGTMLGPKQRAWFLETMKSSSAHWKLWANALPLIPLYLDMSSLPLTDYHDSVFNIDSWAGYPYELGELMGYFEVEGVTGVVSLSGDHHLHGAGTIQRSATDGSAAPVAVDFSVAGISSSPIFGDIVAAAGQDHPDFAALVYSDSDTGIKPVWNLSMLRGVSAAYTYSKTGLISVANWMGPNKANPGLSYVDVTANGYGLASFDKGELLVQLVSMNDCRENFEQPPKIKHIASFRLPLWPPEGSPSLEGPEFEGPPPFPFETPKV